MPPVKVSSIQNHNKGLCLQAQQVPEVRHSRYFGSDDAEYRQHYWQAPDVECLQCPIDNLDGYFLKNVSQTRPM